MFTGCRWKKLDPEVGEVPLAEGEDLIITEDMYGSNHYKCVAYNEVKAQPRTASREVKFHVGE